MDGEVIGRQEALEILERRLLENTLVEWVVECGEIDGRGQKICILKMFCFR